MKIRVGAAGSMGAMVAVGTATAASSPFMILAFQAIGLGFLLAFRALFYQAFLVAILALTIFGLYFSYRFHGQLGPFVPTLPGPLVIYGTICPRCIRPILLYQVCIHDDFGNLVTNLHFLGREFRLGC